MNIKDESGNVLAVLLKSDYDKKGISFFTPDDYSQQLAYMHHPEGYEIQAHAHNEVKREILMTKEVLIIRKGKLRCDFYSDRREYIKSIVVTDGDVLLLASGGHGFTCIEETEMYEIKQGPYAGDNDKTRFDKVPEENIIIINPEEE